MENGAVIDHDPSLPRKDPRKDSVDRASEALKVASSFFKAKGDGENPRYAHLESVASLNRVLTLSDAEMTDSLLIMGFDERGAQVIPAIYMGKRSGALVDAVVTRKGAEINPVIMLHEFVHRASDLGGLEGRADPYHDQMYEILNFSKDTREEMKASSPDEYKVKLAQTKEIIRVFNEGLTQWATLNLANRTATFNPPVTDETYSDEAVAVDEWFHSALSPRGMSVEQVEELMLDLALTGDFSRVKEALPIGDDLRKIGIGEDFYVSNLLRGIYSSYLLKRFDRILGPQDFVDTEEAGDPVPPAVVQVLAVEPQTEVKAGIATTAPDAIATLPPPAVEPVSHNETREFKKALPLPAPDYEGYREQLARYFRTDLLGARSMTESRGPITSRVITAIDSDIFGGTTTQGQLRPPDVAGFVPFGAVDDFLKREGDLSDAEIADAENALELVTEAALYKYGKWPNNRRLPMEALVRQKAFLDRFPESPKPAFIAMTHEVLQQAAGLVNAEMDANPNYRSFPDKRMEHEAINAALVKAEELINGNRVESAT